MGSSFLSLLRGHRGLLVWGLLLSASAWYTYTPAHYGHSASDRLLRLAPALQRIRNAHLLLVWGLLASVAARPLWWPARWRAPTRSHAAWAARLALAGFWAGGYWLAECGLRRYLAAEYYTVWKYRRGGANTPPEVGAPAWVPWALRDVQDPAELGPVRLKLVFALGLAGPPTPAEPVLQALAQDPDQESELRQFARRALQMRPPTRVDSRPPTLSTDTAATSHDPLQQDYQ